MIRPALRTDIPRIMQIRAAVRENRLSDPSKVTEDDVLAYVTDARLLVWDHAGQVAGFAAWAPDGLIWALFVDPDHEGTGIGSALLARALQSLSQSGQAKAHLTTDTGTRAEAFYRAQGWTDSGRTVDGEIRFTRALQPATGNA